MSRAGSQTDLPLTVVVVGDAITFAIWTILSMAAWRLVHRRRLPPTDTFWLVAVCCNVVALDKLVDLQTPVYLAAKRGLLALVAALGLHESRHAVRAVLAAAAAAAAVAATCWLVVRARDRARAPALTGLGLVVAMVSLRLLPDLGIFDELTCWVVEVAAILLVAIGLRRGWRAAGGTGGGSVRGAGPGAASR